ncbi:MAG: hypothetical protein AAGA23_03545 [Pseudomonadota bacterium]
MNPVGWIMGWTARRLRWLVIGWWLFLALKVAVFPLILAQDGAARGFLLATLRNDLWVVLGIWLLTAALVADQPLGRPDADWRTRPMTWHHVFLADLALLGGGVWLPVLVAQGLALMRLDLSGHEVVGPLAWCALDTAMLVAVAWLLASVTRGIGQFVITALALAALSSLASNVVVEWVLEWRGNSFQDPPAVQVTLGLGLITMAVALVAYLAGTARLGQVRLLTALLWLLVVAAPLLTLPQADWRPGAAEFRDVAAKVQVREASRAAGFGWSYEDFAERKPVLVPLTAELPSGYALQGARLSGEWTTQAGATLRHRGRADLWIEGGRPAGNVRLVPLLAMPPDTYERNRDQSGEYRGRLLYHLSRQREIATAPLAPGAVLRLPNGVLRIESLHRSAGRVDLRVKIQLVESTTAPQLNDLVMMRRSEAGELQHFASQRIAVSYLRLIGRRPQIWAGHFTLGSELLAADEALGQLVVLERQVSPAYRTSFVIESLIPDDYPEPPTG